MTHLRKMMLEELQRRHYSEATRQRYIRLIERFSQHFHYSPGHLGPHHIREYQAQLFTVHGPESGAAQSPFFEILVLFEIRIVPKGTVEAADADFGSTSIWSAIKPSTREEMKSL